MNHRHASVAVRCSFVLGVALALNSSAQDAGPELGPQLGGWSYTLSARPLAEQYADPGDRLSDGKSGRSGGTAIWRGGTIPIQVDLAGRCRIDAVRIYQHRHNLNYKMTRLAVLARRGGGWEELASQSGFVGPTPTMDFVHTLPLGGVETDALRLDFIGVGVLSLSEIELFGARLAEDKAAPGLYAGVPFQAGDGAMAREEDLDGDGQVEVILENAAVRAIFTPAAGGICRSLRLKPSGAELVYSRESGYGLLRDQLWQPQYSFADRVYFHRLENAAEQAGVELWATGVGGMMSFTEIRKRVTLRSDSPVLQVHYSLENQPSSQTDYEYGFWSHNWLGQIDAEDTYYFPTTEGVRAFTLDADAANHSDETWYHSPARGWTAVVSSGGAGLGIELPFKYLNLFYHWHGTGAVAATHEWRFNLITLRAGEKLEADLTLVPFEGLTRVDGVVDGVVGSIETSVDGGNVDCTMRLLTPRGVGVATATASLELGGKTLQTLCETSLQPGTLSEMKTRVEDLEPGVYTVAIDVLAAGELLGRIERSLRIGDVPFTVRMAPECEQVGRRDRQAATKPGHEISTAVVTPHVPWARPLAGGGIRALVLMDDFNCREAVELAQRIDLELDYVKFRTTLDKELLYQGDLSILTLDAAQRALLDRLRTREYDVMLFAGFRWDFHFTPEIRKHILDKVRAGTGLVLIQPDGFDQTMASELPIAGVAKTDDEGRSMSRWHQWALATDHPLVTGLDWSRFPVTRRHEYAVPPQGQVLATIGDDQAPLLVIDHVGKGRVAATTWDTLTHALSYRGYSALTPILSYRGGWLRPEFGALPGGYQEWWFALLTRLVAWAAGRDTGVAVTDAPPLEIAVAEAGTAVLELTVDTDRALPDATVEAHWFNADGTEPRRITTATQLLEGRTRVSVPVPAAPAVTAGSNAVCFVIRDGAGVSLAWGFTTVRVAAPVWMKALNVSPDTILPEGGVWQQDQPVEAAVFTPSRPLGVTFELSAPAPVGLTYVLELTDSRDRLLARAQDVVPAGGSSAEMTFALPELVEQGIEVTARLGVAQGIWDIKRTRVVAYRPRVWRRFWYTSWGGQYLWRTKYLFDFNNRLVRDFGVDVSFWGTSELNAGKVRDNAFWGINHSWLGLMSYFGRGVPDFMDRQFGTKAAEYAKTRDQRHLVRTPSLVDPEWRAAVRASLLERVRSTSAAGGTYDYCMGDEMSLTHYTTFHDYDWSEASLADFRRWLRGRHADLATLNAAWNTDYVDWDAVLPLTREQAREAQNPAPWFEFRMYMNDQLADFYRFVQTTIRSVDPHARCGLSGTQSPEAGNGMDWWKLSDAFSYYHSYNTSWSNEMRRSFQRRGGADQSPYFSGYSATDPNAENRMWWCLFHDTRGISAWKTGLFFYGDFTETASGRDTKRHLRTFRRGIWRLLRDAVRQHDGIAIYYSMPSVIAGALTGEERKLNAARDAWVKIIEDSGLQYEFVAYEQVADGFLLDSDFKVVILPYTLALSEMEATELRAFTDRGGALIATRPVGIRDDLGRPRRPGLLDDVFGMKLAGDVQAVEPVVVTRTPIGDMAAGTQIRLPIAVTDVVADGAAVLATAGDGTIPALLTHKQGRAVLLNLDLTHYEQERRFHSPTETQLRQILLQALAQAGVQPVYPLRLESGRAPHVEVVRYAAPGVEFLCLLNGDEEPDVATIELGAGAYVYDVRAESGRGRIRALTVPLQPKCARVFCLSARPIPAPVISASPEATRASGAGEGMTCGSTFRFSVARDSSAPFPELVRVEVTDADGRERGELMQTLSLRHAERVESVIPLALNDPAGTWKVTATDIVSGQRAVARVEVR